MIIVSYDISDTKIRTRFSNYLKKFGYRIQYSVFEIRNSARILNNIQLEIAKKYEPSFCENDSILVYCLSSSCKIHRYGYAKHDEEELIIIE